MEKLTKINPEDIHLVKIGVFKSNYSIDFNLIDTLSDFNGFQFCIGQNTAVNVEKKAVRIRLNIKISAQNSKKEELPITGDFAIEFHYKIKKFKNYTMLDEKGNHAFKTEMGATILGITYSTARGIVFSHTECSVLPNVILPVLDPKHLFNSEYTFDSLEKI